MNVNRDYLLDLRDEIEKIQVFSAAGEEAFYADERTQYAVMMAYARIGEIAKRLPPDLLDQRPEAEWRPATCCSTAMMKLSPPQSGLRC